MKTKDKKQKAKQNKEKNIAKHIAENIAKNKAWFIKWACSVFLLIILLASYQIYKYSQPSKEENIIRVLSSETHKNYTEGTLGELFFDDFDHDDYDESEHNIRGAEFILDDLRVLRGDSYSYMSDDRKNEMVTLEVQGTKKKNGVPVAEVKGSCFFGLKRSSIFERKGWIFMSRNRTFSTPQYKCLNVPQKPEDISYALEDLLKDSHITIKEFVVNEDCNSIDVTYEEKETTSFAEAVVTKKRTLLYQGYYDLWQAEGPDAVLDREYTKLDFREKYTCDYNGKVFELDIVDSQVNKDSWAALLYYDGKRIAIDRINPEYKTVGEIPGDNISDILKRCETNPLSFAQPKCVVRIVLSPDADGTRISLNGRKETIYAAFDESGTHMLLPQKDNPDALVNYDMAVKTEAEPEIQDDGEE